MNYEFLRKKIESHSVISFDVFDTLVKRDVPQPECVFDMVEKRYNAVYNKRLYKFRNLRIQAYHEAYSKLKAKCTLDDIYNYIHIEESVKEIVKNLEIRTELDVCVKNPDIHDIYEYAVNCNKRIVVTTDMYLPEKIIKEILERCGVPNYERLFLSCKYGKSKSDGTLYDVICCKMEIDKKELLHIGDGIKNDILRARMRGISTFFIKNKRMSYYSERGLSDEEKAEYRIQQTIINNHIGLFKDRRESLGFEVFGPLACGFVQWLNNCFTQMGITKIFFLAREGQIFKELFERMYPNMEYDIHYLFVSRKSLIPPTYWIQPDYESIMNSVAKSKTVKVSSLIYRWGLDAECFMSEITESGLSIETVLDMRKWRTDERIGRLFRMLEESIISKSKKEYCVLKEYLKQENFGGECAIVDIGWNGGMQNAFQKISRIWEIPTRVHGFYMGINSQNLGSKLFNSHGYLYDENNNDKNRVAIYSFSGPLELTFTAPHYSTIGYLKEENEVVPIMDLGEYSENDKTLSRELEYSGLAQKGIKEYIELAIKNEVLYKTGCNASFRNCKLFGLSPQKQDIEIFERFRAKDMFEEKHFVDPSYKGFLGQHSIINGFWNSVWKAGYMKRVLKIPLPYYKIYIWIRRRIR